MVAAGRKKPESEGKGLFAVDSIYRCRMVQIWQDNFGFGDNPAWGRGIVSTF